ncbi:unnamed protein product [Gordionus sp. m RMFG-2023]|uniref:uncharacterized protein LOC135923953 n=1 Tax=Gordionus sp. m RMFG-2023 TaxID=3053472 RepID=UPI0030E2261D
MRKIHNPLANEKIFVDKLSNKTSLDCQFCSYKINTALDELNISLSNTYAYTFSNAFKIDKWHSIIAPKIHNPTELQYQHVKSMMVLSQQWFGNASNHEFTQLSDDQSKIETHYFYPIISWDSLSKGGASQLHPHLQCFLSQEHYYGKMYGFLQNIKRSSGVYNSHKYDYNNLDENIEELAQSYREYIEDLINVHYFFGLTIPCPGDVNGLHLNDKSCVILSYLNAIKEHHIFVIYQPYEMYNTLNNSVNSFDRFVKAIYAVIDTYRAPVIQNATNKNPSLNASTTSSHPKYAFSGSIMYPPIKYRLFKDRKILDFPTIAHFVSRAPYFDDVSDFSAIELFVINNVVHDPYTTIKDLKSKIPLIKF